MAYATNLAAINAAREAHGESYIHMTSIIKLDGEWHVQMTQPRISDPINSIVTEYEGAFAFPTTGAAMVTGSASAAFFASRVSNVAVEIPEAEVDPRSHKVCPHCGSEELYQGEVKGIKGSGLGLVVNEDLVGGCHACDWSYDVCLLYTSPSPRD